MSPEHHPGPASQRGPEQQPVVHQLPVGLLDHHEVDPAHDGAWQRQPDQGRAAGKHPQVAVVDGHGPGQVRVVTARGSAALSPPVDQQELHPVPREALAQSLEERDAIGRQQLLHDQDPVRDGRC